MSITPVSQSPEESKWKMPPPQSPAYSRLEQILRARYQNWAELSMSAKVKYVATAYIPEDIDRSIEGLQDDELARAIFRACIHGDLVIAKSIWEKRGPFTIDYAQGVSAQELINGEVEYASTQSKHVLTNLKSSAELVELMEWMPTVGLGFMVGVGTDIGIMLQSGKLKTPIKEIAWSSHFQGELPMLSAGVLESPELMLALRNKTGSSAYPGIYQDILCWVEEDVAAEFPEHLHPYDSIQSLFLDNEDGTEYIEVPIREVSDEITRQIRTTHLVDADPALSDGVWKYRSLDLQTYPRDPSNPLNNIALGYQADEALQHGFNHKPGCVLCRTSVDFLCAFPSGSIAKDNLQKAQDFAKDYFPLDLAMLQTKQAHLMHQDCLRRNPGMRQGVHDSLYQIKSFYKAFADASTLQPHFQEAINSALFSFVKQHHCYIELDVDSMIALHQGLAMDNQGFAVEVDSAGLKKLRDAGFRFSDDSKTLSSLRKDDAGTPLMHRPVDTLTDVRFDPESVLAKMIAEKTFGGLDQDYADRYTNAIAMNLWPAETNKPADVKEAVVMAGRKKKWGETQHEQALLAYIDHAGMDACAAVATSTAHWTFLKNHFGREAMNPYMTMTTRQTRGRILMDDLGM